MDQIFSEPLLATDVDEVPIPSWAAEWRDECECDDLLEHVDTIGYSDVLPDVLFCDKQEAFNIGVALGYKLRNTLKDTGLRSIVAVQADETPGPPGAVAIE